MRVTELQQAVTRLEESASTLQHQLAMATDRLNDHKEEQRATRGYADRLAQELIQLKQFKALERASMPVRDSDSEEEATTWVASPRKKK